VRHPAKIFAADNLPPRMEEKEFVGSATPCSGRLDRTLMKDARSRRQSTLFLRRHGVFLPRLIPDFPDVRRLLRDRPAKRRSQPMQQGAFRLRPAVTQWRNENDNHQGR
jgi:hypothetical protein